MIQYALICRMLSSISRHRNALDIQKTGGLRNVMQRRVLGMKRQRNKSPKPCVSSCSSRSRSGDPRGLLRSQYGHTAWCRWNAGQAGVQSAPYPAAPGRYFGSQITRRTSQKISAPPPGGESMPASRNRSSTSRVEICPAREVSDLDHRERFQCTCGKRSFRTRSLWRYQSSVSRMQAADNETP